MKSAIDAGYRHIDCAYCYDNEDAVGDAIQSKIADGTVNREQLFVTSKVHFLLLIVSMCIVVCIFATVVKYESSWQREKFCNLN